MYMPTQMTIPVQEHVRVSSVLPVWLRITLLIVLGYEAAGCLAGGALLVMAPDGHLMKMPVELMNGIFPDFLIPGIILFLLGILNSYAFYSVLRKKTSDWLATGFGLGGLTVWFITEIIILQELHWLHLMWGLPVLIGWTTAVPLIARRNDAPFTNSVLLYCGAASAIWYVAINVFVPALDENYRSISTTVSELSAIDAPTRITWVLLAVFYPLLFMMFGWGILRTSETEPKLRITGALIILYSIFNYYWPPMHQRHVIQGGGETLTDSLHIIWAMVTLAFMLLLMIIGSISMGKHFRYYTIATILAFFTFGILTAMESPGIAQGTPTPYIGLWERLNIAAFMTWIVALSFQLLARKKRVKTEPRK
jgi:hypothetical protein